LTVGATEIDIDRPRAEVAAYASDLDRTTEWYENITSVSWQTPKPAVEGSRVTFEARFLGRRLRYTYEIRELVPGERPVMSTSEGAFPMETTCAWTDSPEGTRMMLRTRGRAIRVRHGRRPGDGRRDAARQSKGPADPQGRPRGTEELMQAPTAVVPGAPV
jgi:hypothetical protein